MTAGIHRFAAFELDGNGPALRLDGREIPLQPRVFDLLLYLVEDRDRVVSKEELLDTLWPGVVVTESSLPPPTGRRRRRGLHRHAGERFTAELGAEVGHFRQRPGAQRAVAVMGLAVWNSSRLAGGLIWCGQNPLSRIAAFDPNSEDHSLRRGGTN
jgi:hypothetical protein